MSNRTRKARTSRQNRSPEEFAATIYHALDIPLDIPQNNSGISLPITTGKPILNLFD